jgi:hypothetical protein
MKPFELFCNDGGKRDGDVALRVTVEDSRYPVVLYTQNCETLLTASEARLLAAALIEAAETFEHGAESLL